MNKKIIVFSDNHDYDGDMINLLNTEEYDYSVNCGDHLYNDIEVKKHFDYYVDGNNDSGQKHIEIFRVLNKKILITHGHKEWNMNKDKWINNLRELGKNNKCDVVIFGHSHVEMINIKKKPFVVNPGSISLPRTNDKIGTYMIIDVSEDDIKFQIKQIN